VISVSRRLDVYVDRRKVWRVVSYCVVWHRICAQMQTYLRSRFEQSEDDFVHAKHYSCARYGAHEMRRHSSIETSQAFFHPDEAEALNQPGVLELAIGHWFLP